LLRIILRDYDVFHEKILCEQLVRKARAMGLLAGIATRGFLGYGPTDREMDFKLADDVPVVLEIIDTDDNIRRFLPEADAMLEIGVITLQRVTVVRSGRDKSRVLEGTDRSPT
jgi:PII-like signaling protein